MKTPFFNKAKKLLEKSTAKYIYYDPFTAEWIITDKDLSNLYIKIPRKEFLESNLDDIEDLINKYKYQFSNITEQILFTKYKKLLELTSASAIAPLKQYKPITSQEDISILSQEDFDEEFEPEEREDLISRYKLPRKKIKYKIEIEDETDEDLEEFENSEEQCLCSKFHKTTPSKLINKPFKKPTSKIPIVSQDENEIIIEEDEIIIEDKPPKKWFEKCKEKAKKFADNEYAFCMGLWNNPEKYPGGEKMKKSFGESLNFLKEQIIIELTPEELVELNKKYPGVGMEIFKKSKTYAEYKEEFGDLTDYVIKIFALDKDYARKFRELFPDEKIFSETLKVLSKYNIRFPDYNFFATLANAGLINESLPKALELLGEKSPEKLKGLSTESKKTIKNKLIKELKNYINNQK